MPVQLESFQIWRIKLPAGREIGDNMCRYSSFTTVVLALHSTDGSVGWGFGSRVTEGTFRRPVSWHVDVPALPRLRSRFESEHWSRLKGRAPLELFNDDRWKCCGNDLLAGAVRSALWDLQAKEKNVPLYDLLGSRRRESVPAYVSYLEFPLSDTQAANFYRQSVSSGSKAIKVKVGHTDPHRDLDRLRLVRDETQGQLEIAIDANLGWSAKETLENISLFSSAGIELAYVEDPMPIDDVQGYQLLAKELPIDVVGHDYASAPADLRPLLDVGGIQRLRVHTSFDYALDVAQLADEYALPLIVGNMTFEMGVHAAVALPRVERIEFSDLAWNSLMKRPVGVVRGRMYPPQEPGLGLEPMLEMLDKYSVSSGDKSSCSAGAHA